MIPYKDTTPIHCEWIEFPPNPTNEHRNTIWVHSVGVDRLALFAINAEQTESKRLGTYRTIKAANDAARRLTTTGRKYRGWSRMSLVRVDPEKYRGKRVVVLGLDPFGGSA